MSLQSRSDNSAVPFILEGRSYASEAETIAQDGARLAPLVFGTLGIGLAASSAAVVNHVLDSRIDIQMSRTHNRPLPQGKLSQTHALTFAALLCALSMLMLWFLVNPLTALLTFASLIGYAVIYTVYLKHATPQNIVIGGAAGAAPPVLLVVLRDPGRGRRAGLPASSP